MTTKIQERNLMPLVLFLGSIIIGLGSFVAGTFLQGTIDQRRFDLLADKIVASENRAMLSIADLAESVGDADEKAAGEHALFRVMLGDLREAVARIEERSKR